MTIKKDDPNLQPAPCGHVHYVRRALAEALGVDMGDVDKQMAEHGQAVMDLDKAWPLPDGVVDGYKEDFDVIFAAEGMEVSGIGDAQFRISAMMRLADKLEAIDTGLAAIMRLFVMDAVISAAFPQSGMVSLLAALSDYEDGDGSPPQKPH